MFRPDMARLPGLFDVTGKDQRDLSPCAIDQEKALSSPLSSFSPDPLPNLQHGVPGMDLNRSAKGSSGRSAIRADVESVGFYLTMITAIALVLRLLVVLIGPFSEVENAYFDQTATQLAIADNIAESQAFALSQQPAGSVEAQLDAMRIERGELQAETLRPEIYQPPGYPVVLSLFAMTGLSHKWLLFVQCAIGAAAVPLVFFVGRSLLRANKPALMASVLVAIHPAMVLSPAMLTADVIVIALVMLGLVGIACTEERTFRSSFGSGVAIGAAALFSPLMVWLTPLAATWVMLTGRRFRSIGLAAMLVVGTAIPAGAWIYRNMELGMLPQLTAGVAVDRLFDTVAMMNATSDDPQELKEIHNALLVEVRAQGAVAENADKGVIDIVDTLGKERVLADRARHLQVIQQASLVTAFDHSVDQAFQVMGIDYSPGGHAEQWLGRVPMGQSASDPATAYAIDGWVAINALVLLGCALGLVLMLWRRQFDAALLLVACFGLLTWMSTTGPGETVRLPFIGLQAILCGVLFASAPQRLKRVKKPKLRKAEKLEDVSTSSLQDIRSTRDTPHPALNAAYNAPVPEPADKAEGEDEEADDARDEEVVQPVAMGRPI
jgi:hypothetical protein